jgi:uncharacterized short protein YbdD (DUF466 family)
MTVRLATVLSEIARGLRAVLGAPDYERYVAQARATNPAGQPVSREHFIRERMEARYSRPGTRCC